MVKFYMMLEVSVGKTQAVIKALEELSEIKVVSAVTGPYDIIAVAEVETNGAVLDFVQSRVHTLQSIFRTVTSTVLS